MNLRNPLAVVSCVGVPITVCTREEAALEVFRLATSDLGHGVDIHLCNAYTLALADKEPEFAAMLKRAAVNFSDGKAVVWANQVLHGRAAIPPNRVYGPDLFLDVFASAAGSGLRHYLLGSTPGVLDALRTELVRRFPGSNIVGVESPPFRAITEEESAGQIDRLAASGAQLVWVGLGTPKQDWEVARLAGNMPAVFCAVGAAFDFVAGNKKQAPKWMQERGGEWLYRLGTEPRRLWKRYLFGNLRFLLAVPRHRNRP